MIAWWIVFAGVAVLVFSTCVAVVLRSVFVRLHLLATTTSVASRLIAVGLAIKSGWNATTASIAVVAAIMVVTAPAMSAATGRLIALKQGLVEEERPA